MQQDFDVDEFKHFRIIHNMNIIQANWKRIWWVFYAEKYMLLHNNE